MSSSLPCNIPYMLLLVQKNILAKVDFKKMDLKAIVSDGKPIPIPSFSILDVGCGFGKWGFLVRDTFDVMMGQQFTKKEWTITIDAVESFPKCITPLQKLIYNKIIKKDILKALPKLKQYDLIIMGDVIEHFEKKQAHELIKKLFDHTSSILISTPLGFMPQGAWAGNEKEIHKSGWTLQDFQTYKIIESKILEDDLTSSIIEHIPNIPEEMKKPISLLVLWMQKK
jgi:hypothetical protein